MVRAEFRGIRLSFGWRFRRGCPHWTSHGLEVRITLAIYVRKKWKLIRIYFLAARSLESVYGWQSEMFDFYGHTMIGGWALCGLLDDGGGSIGST